MTAMCFATRAIHAEMGGNGASVNDLNTANIVIDLCDEFVTTTYGLVRSPVTSQIDNYRSVTLILDSIRRLAAMLDNVQNNLRIYISKGYLEQIVAKDEVGSSTMPSKCNPVDFEQVSTFAALTCSLADTLTMSLLKTTLQRDIHDSSAMRHVGVVMGNLIVALNGCCSGISRLTVNKDVVADDLAKHPETVLEGVQTLLRLMGFDNAYDMCKHASRGVAVKSTVAEYVENLPVEDLIKRRILLQLPDQCCVNYSGVEDVVALEFI
jgi:adenylosuccinate lyase